MNYHILIQQERRVSTEAEPRELAIPIDGTQLHTMGQSINDLNDPQIIYAASWDMESPWIVVLKGDNSVLKMRYAGWPVVDEATWTKNNPVIERI